MLSRRNKQSCDRCKQRKRKCEGGMPCTLCNAANAQCTMSVAPKKRGPKTAHDQDLSLGLFLEPGTPKDNPAFVYQHPIAPQIDTEVLQLYYQMNPKLTPSMFVNPTQHDADYSFGALLNTDSFQPNMDWNPSTEQSSSIDFMPQIDPEIVEIYKMMNPKLLSVSNTSLTHVPGELCIPEYPHITSEFLLHLVTLFFTFFHPYAPILEETDFLQKLLPFNTHTDILMYAIYAIGCKFSQHPSFFDAPIRGIRDRGNLFYQKACALIPKDGLMSNENIDIAQALLILSFFELDGSESLGSNRTATLAYELSSIHSVSSGWQYNSYKKRLLWGFLLFDSYKTLVFGLPIALKEEEFLDIFMDVEYRSSSSDNVMQDNMRGGSDEKWKVIITGYPTDTLFSACDKMCKKAYLEDNTGIYQIDHLMAETNKFGYVVQANFFLRKAIDLHRNQKHDYDNESDSIARIMLKIVDPDHQLSLLHKSMIDFYDQLPEKVKVWSSFLAINKQAAVECPLSNFPFTDGYAFLLNLTFLSTIALLHSSNVTSGKANKYAIDSKSQSFCSSPEIVATVYSATITLLKIMYTDWSIYKFCSMTTMSPIICPLLSIAPMCLLNSPQFSPALNGMGPGLEPLETTLLPVMDKISQIWPSDLAVKIRALAANMKSKEVPQFPL